MVRIFVLSMMCVFFALPVQAREPECGFVEERVVEDVYEAAERVDYFIDVTADIEGACRVSENLKQWDAQRPKDQRHDRDYKAQRDALVRGLESAFQSLRGPLISYYGYVYGDLNGELKAVRVARIRAMKKKIHAARHALGVRGNDMRAFMDLSQP